MTDDVLYHRLNAQNADLLIGAQVFDNPVDPAQLARFVDEPGHELVFATLQGVVIGFASGTILLHPDKLPGFFLNEVDVAPKHQQNGIGTRLCAQLMEIARDLGCQGIWLATEDDNVPARALYRSLKARETTGIVVYDWDGAMDG